MIIIFDRLIFLSLFLLSFGNIRSTAEIVFLSPQKGEILKSGQEYEIKWQKSEEIFRVNLLYEIDEGKVEIGVIARGLEGESFFWQVPKRHRLVVLILKAYNREGNFLAKVFSPPFEITPEAEIDSLARQLSIKENQRVGEVKESEQRVRIYENGVLVFQAICSTGRRGRTPKGIFFVCNKWENPKSRSCGAWMPYWVGLRGERIGWGKIGLHGPPYYFAKKRRRYIGLARLGQMASAGCIRIWGPPLSGSNKAKEFQQLAFIGMKIIIRR